MGFPLQVTHIQVVLQGWNIEYIECGRLSLTVEKHTSYLNVVIMDMCGTQDHNSVINTDFIFSDYDRIKHAGLLLSYGYMMRCEFQSNHCVK